MGSDVLAGTQDHISPLAVGPTPVKLVPANSVAVVVRSGILGRTIPVARVPFATTLNQDMKALVPRAGVEPGWVALGLRAFETELLRSTRKAGTTVASLDMPRFLGFSLPLPQLDEQRRIVAILEDHLSHLDAADRALGTSVARASSLVESTIVQALSTMSPEPVPLGTLLAEKLVNGRSVPTQDGGFPVLRLTALKDSTVDLSQRKGGEWTAEEAAPFLVRGGDIMVARGNGSLSLVARGALVRPDPDPVAFPDTMIRVRPRSEAISSTYLVAVWNSRFVRSQIERVARTTAGIYKVNQRMLEHVLVPAVPLDKQVIMEKSLTELSQEQNRLVNRVAAGRLRSRDLRRSLLDAAFRGDLTADLRKDG
jgi:type I restriction enzyme S subunit